MTDPRSRFVVAVIDDDRGVLRSLEYLLESADHAVRLFTSSRELLESGCLPEIDCLISDVDMPGIDGVDLLNLIHAIRPGLPTVLITGFPDASKRLAPPGASKPRLFTKPFDGPSLLAAVSESLRSSRKDD